MCYGYICEMVKRMEKKETFRTVKPKTIFISLPARSLLGSELRLIFLIRLQCTILNSISKIGKIDFVLHRMDEK